MVRQRNALPSLGQTVSEEIPIRMQEEEAVAAAGVQGGV